MTIFVDEKIEGEKREFELSELNKNSEDKVSYVQIRYRGSRLEVESLIDNKLTLKEKTAFAVGQSVVFYTENNKCIGGGIL